MSYEYRPTSTRTESSLSLRQESLTAETSFSVQLWNMLNSETDAGRDAVQWLRNGNGFVINSQNEFEQKILPKYFDSPCIFQSFVRRLYRSSFYNRLVNNIHFILFSENLSSSIINQPLDGASNRPIGVLLAVEFMCSLVR